MGLFNLFPDGVEHIISILFIYLTICERFLKACRRSQNCAGQSSSSTMVERTIELHNSHDIYFNGATVCTRIINNLPGFTRIYQDPSLKIPSWMAIGKGKKANARPYIPQVMIKPRLKNIHCLCRDNSIPQPVPLLTNPASKLELPHVQTIPLLEQFETVPLLAPSYHLKKSSQRKKVSK